ncbi:MAG: EAL domain-containing protein [Chromatiaceae bacterium]|nr:EAL domain-containing protein [Chromatiaceae bacterium]
MKTSLKSLLTKMLVPLSGSQAKRQDLDAPARTRENPAAQRLQEELRAAKERLDAESAARHTAETHLAASQRQLQALSDNMRDVVWVLDAETRRLLYVSPSILGLRGYTAAEVMAEPLDAALTPEGRAQLQALLAEQGAAFRAGTLATGTPFSAQLSQARKDGTLVWTEMLMHFTRQPGTGAIELQGVTRDITAWHQLAESIRHMAQHDSLTGLPNRALFSLLVERALASAKRQHQRLALIFLDVDRLKRINDNHGHAIGDGVLREIAQRISGSLRNSDTLGRMGGDEFILFLPNIGSQEHAIEVANKVREAIRPPITLDTLTLSVSLSVGIAIYPEHGQNEQELAKNADVAMSFSKKIGRDCVTGYVPELHASIAPECRPTPSCPSHGIQLAAIKQALRNEEFVYYYQPKISLLTGKVSGAEALMRWVKPDGEVIPPDNFIPLAIESGLIKQMTLAMLPRLMADLSIIQDILPGLVMSFNLTAWNLESDEIVKAVRAAIAKFQLDPGLLQAELTESSVIHSSGKARDHILELTGMGLGLAMDDFGTGFSSIEVLSQWPFSAVKIDQGLIRRMETSDKCTTLVRSSIQMAHQLGIKTVAEGVESRPVFDFLLNAGCTEAQGFWLGRPMAFPDFLTYLKRDERWSSVPSGLIHIAQIDHIHWRRSLIDHAIAKAFGQEGGNAIKGLEVEMNPRLCRFGQWFQDQGRHFAGLPAFDALAVPHDELHRLGQELLLAVEQGQPSDRITHLIRLLTDQSGEILERLQALEYESLVTSGEVPMPSAGAA